MQHWEILIVPLIALGVWVLSTIFKGGEDDRAKKGARRPGTPYGKSPARRPVTDLDRFLEEARRRREAEERPQPPPPPVRPTVARPPLRERPTPRRQPPPRPAPTLRSDEGFVAMPVARPVEQPPAAEPILVAPATPEAPPFAPLPVTPPTTREARSSPIVKQVRALLSKPQTVGTAFVLREILDRPLCKRRRR
jgi:hypothetical protein